MLKDEDLSYPFEDTWISGSDDVQVQFKQDNTYEVYDQDGLYVGAGYWNVTKTFEDDLTSGVILLTFQDPGNELPETSASYYYHVSENMLVIHGLDDNGDGCDPMVRSSVGATVDMRRVEVAIAEPPNFCTLRDVE